MLLKEIEKRIEEIKAKAWDYEVAADLERDLYVYYLEEVVNGKHNKVVLKEAAKLVLTTSDIDFRRG